MELSGPLANAGPPRACALTRLADLSFASRNSGQAEAVGLLGAAGRTIPGPVAHRARAGGVARVTAASDSLRGSGRGVRQHLLIPLPYVSAHIVQTKRIRLLLPHRARSTATVVPEPCIIQQILVLLSTGVLRLRPRPAAILLFHIRRDGPDTYELDLPRFFLPTRTASSAPPDESKTITWGPAVP
jgi:hypothetical protein